MATLQINLSEILQQRIATKAAECGYKSLQEYVEAVLEAEVAEYALEVDEDLESLLLQRLDSGPGIELTPEYRVQLMEQLKQERQPTEH